MSLASGFVDKCSRFCNPVMLEVSPVTTQSVATDGANVVVSAQLGAGETFENDAESSRRDVKTARLKPYAFRIRNPEALVLYVDVSYEVFAATLVRLKTVGETVEGSNRHMFLFLLVTIAFAVTV